VNQDKLLLRPLIELLYQPWMIDGNDCAAVRGVNDCKRILKFTEKNLPKYRLVHHKSHMT
jgi:hypothetical protein